MTSISSNSISLGRSDIEITFANQRSITLTRVSTYPKIVGIFLRFLGYATELRTQNGSIYVNINSLISHLFVPEGFLKDKTRKINNLKGFIQRKFRKQNFNKSINEMQAESLYIKIQLIKNNQHIEPLFNDLESQEVSNCPILDGLMSGHYTGQLLNHKPEGPGIFIYKGRLIDRHCRYEGNYINGKREGKFIVYSCNENTKLSKIEGCLNYVNGKLHGDFIGLLSDYHSAGTIVKCTFVNGNRHGMCFSYYTNSSQKNNLFKVEQYSHGKLVKDFWNEPLETLFPNDVHFNVDDFMNGRM